MINSLANNQVVQAKKECLEKDFDIFMEFLDTTCSSNHSEINENIMTEVCIYISYFDQLSTEIESLQVA